MKQHNKTYHKEFDREPEYLKDMNGAEVVKLHGKKKKKKKKIEEVEQNKTETKTKTIRVKLVKVHADCIAPL